MGNKQNQLENAATTRFGVLRYETGVVRSIRPHVILLVLDCRGGANNRNAEDGNPLLVIDYCLIIGGHVLLKEWICEA